MATETLFYDGHCGLCHRCVRFVLFVDRSGDKFRFAPLGGESFRAAVAESERNALPDSLVLLTDSRKLLTRSAAILRILRCLGGGWKILAAVADLLPGRLWDSLYDAIARNRLRWFAPPADTCPVLPAHLRARFDP